MTSGLPIPANRKPPPGTIATHWVIYDHPADQPEKYVLRATFLMGSNAVVQDRMAWAHKNVEVLRELVAPMHLYRMPRLPGDDPVILEVWL